MSEITEKWKMEMLEILIKYRNRKRQKKSKETSLKDGNVKRASC